MGRIIHYCGSCGAELFGDEYCRFCTDEDPEIVFRKLQECVDYLYTDSCRRVVTMGGYDAFIEAVKRILEDKGETTRLSSGTET